MLDILRAGQEIAQKVFPENRANSVARTFLRNFDQNPTKEPQRAYEWEVTFTDPFGDFGNTAKFYAKSSGIPTSLNENIKRFHAGREYSYPSRNTSPRIFRVTFWDNQELEVYKFFDRWLTLMQFGAGNLKVNPENYTRDITLSLKDSSGQLDSQVFAMRNCFPTEMSETTLSYSESSDLMFDVIFYYTDKVLL